MSNAPDSHRSFIDTLRALRDAVRISPDNLPLRQHLAELLISHGELADAEREFRAALELAPNSLQLRLGLARTFFEQGKQSHAIVIVEDLVKSPDAPARAYFLHARLLAAVGDVESAVREYHRSVELDPSLAETDFAIRLGIGADQEGSDVVEGRLRTSWGEDSATTPRDIEKPAIRFHDVGGMERLKEEIRLKIIHPLTHPNLYKAYGKTAGGGILMYGPPGCGKTYLARATAGEIRASFIAVGISDVLDMWIGNSERNLQTIFRQAREHRPCVLFFDEVDALGASRADMRHHAGRQLINQFLSEMDNVTSSNEGVLILAATNAPWHLDSAFRRPGRFDRVLFVPPPDAPARSAILRLQCRGKPTADIDFEHLGKRSEGFSGADLKAVVDLAVERKLQEALNTGVPKALTTSDLTAAVTELKPTTKEWFATAQNYALYSNQGGVYDDILRYLKV